jgi:methionine synthase / methylenetetrahydrofolate reductase(NADPH)
MDGVTLRSLLGEAPLLADGGMGTALIERGADVSSCLERWNVDHPERVVEVHRGFVRSGSRVVLTNTFGANRYRLDAHGARDRVAELNAAAVALARDAGAQLVAGSMGPLGVRLAPYGRVRTSDARDAYAEQAAALADAGADLLAIETQSDLREMEEAIGAALAEAPGLAVIVTATFTRDDRTLLGSPADEVAERLASLGADALGVNCGEGPAQALRVIRTMRPKAGGVPIVARPNAGGPAQVGGRLVYPATPAYLAEHALAFVEAGARLVGGCCGTGPAHTAAVARSMAAAAEPPEAPVAPGSDRAADDA